MNNWTDRLAAHLNAYPYGPFKELYQGYCFHCHIVVIIGASERPMRVVPHEGYYLCSCPGNSNHTVLLDKEQIRTPED